MDWADDPWATCDLEISNFTNVMHCEKMAREVLAPIPTACQHLFHILGTLSEQNSQKECMLEHIKQCAKLVTVERVRKYNLMMKVMVISYGL